MTVTKIHRRKEKENCIPYGFHFSTCCKLNIWYKYFSYTLHQPRHICGCGVIFYMFNAKIQIYLFSLTNTHTHTHRRNAQYNVTVYQQHGVVATPTNNAAVNMQLMPYTAQTKTLNPDELSKLYSMNQYARPMLPSSNMLNFQTQIHTGAIGMSGTPQNPIPNIANPMSLAQANTNSAPFIATSPYVQQGTECKISMQMKFDFGNFQFVFIFFNQPEVQSIHIHIIQRLAHRLNGH